MKYTFENANDFLEYYSKHLDILAKEYYDNYGDCMYVDLEDIEQSLKLIALEKFEVFNKNKLYQPSKKNIKSTLYRLKPYFEAEILTNTTKALKMPIVRLSDSTLIDVTFESVSDKQLKYNEDLAVYYDIDDEVTLEVSFNEIQEAINKAISTLTEREQSVIKLRFGFKDDRPMTLSEVGSILPSRVSPVTSRDRIRQIEAKALRKLRHSRRANMVKHLYKEWYEGR